ncbi:transketolase [Gammaproteobacteria bacterium]|nr:transketolase [Gammaproteobacteria bacterium]
MGDLIGKAVVGEMYYVPKNEFTRVLNSELCSVDKAKIYASLCRINTLYMIAKAGSGHIGSSFSSMDIISWIHLNKIFSKNTTKTKGEHIFFSSKGHDAPAIYSSLIGVGELDFDLLHQLRRIEGLPGHPDVSIPGVITNTGSLGMGISKAKGMIFANRRNNIRKNIFVLTGDGELQEGQFWESLLSAANYNISELIVIIDHNKLQSDTFVSNVSDLGDLESKLQSFGWHVSRCDGNNLEEFSNIVESLSDEIMKPKVIIADTVKGKGVSFMEHTSEDSDTEFYKFHSGAPSSDLYYLAVQELITNSNMLLKDLKQQELSLERIDQPNIQTDLANQKLISAYSDSLLAHVSSNKKIVVLDADLIKDTGIAPIKEKFPDQFLECGIAEQDMVSQAGGMALAGMIPIVHSFACFLSTRANEQIYNNSTEHTKIIYVGSLAGVLPGGPGHSHQSVRDISALGGMPNMTLVEPSCEKEVKMLLDWTIEKSLTSSYIRLTSVPWNISFDLPKNYIPRPGTGVNLTNGKKVIIIAYGPIMLESAFQASQLFQDEHDIEVKVINLPWLNNIDSEWLINEIDACKHLISIDNHFYEGGQGARIAEIISKNNIRDISFTRMAIESIPECGTNDEVLNAHKLNAKAIFERLNLLYS